MMGLLTTITKYWPLILLILAVVYFFAPPKQDRISEKEAFEELIKSKNHQINYLSEENRQLREELAWRKEMSGHGKCEA